MKDYRPSFFFNSLPRIEKNLAFASPSPQILLYLPSAKADGGVMPGKFYQEHFPHSEARLRYTRVENDPDRISDSAGERLRGFASHARLRGMNYFFLKIMQKVL